MNLFKNSFSVMLLFTSLLGSGVAWAAAPTIAIDNATLPYTENAAETQIDAGGTLSDPENDWEFGTLVVQITSNGHEADEISIADNLVGTINTIGPYLRDGVTDIGSLNVLEGTVTGSTKLVITFNANANNTLVQQVLQSIRYRNTSDDPGSSNRTVTFTATDKDGESVSDTRTISVTEVNDPLDVGFFDTDTVNFSIGGNAVVLDAGDVVTLTDDTAVFNGGSITAEVITGHVTTEDELRIGTVGKIRLISNTIIHDDGFTIAIYTGGTGADPLVISLYEQATVARVRDLLAALQYYNTNASATDGSSRTVSVTLNNGDGAQVVSNITVNLFDAPVIDLDADNSSGAVGGRHKTSFTEGAGSINVADSDPEITNSLATYKSLTVTLTNRPDGVDETLSSSIADGATEGGDIINVIAYNSVTGELKFDADPGDGDSLLDESTIIALMKAVRYNNTDQSPTTSDIRNVAFSVTDSADNVSAVSTAEIAVVNVNDAPSGSVSITGTTREHEVLVADASGVSDLDGVGGFSYRWQRDGVDIDGATSATYTLVREDVGTALKAFVDYTDDGGASETASSTGTSLIDGDYDDDNTIDDVDIDDDEDGMLDTYEDENGLNKWDPSDGGTADLDKDGKTNLYESGVNSQADVDDYAPLTTAPADISVDAVGLFTSVSIGSGTAVDGKDGAITPRVTHVNNVPVSDKPTRFRPGENVVTWTATDAAGNGSKTVEDKDGNDGTADQVVNVTPLVEISRDQVAAEGGTATFFVDLNGPAITYPVIVPFTVSGSADAADYNPFGGDIVAGDIQIASGLRATVTVDIVNDNPAVVDDGETLIVTLGTPTNAVLGARSTHTMTIMEGNVAPTVVSLSASQDGGATTVRVVEKDSANVVVTAVASDPNGDAISSYDWTATDNALIDGDGVDNTFTFTPDTVGTYTLRLTVSDPGGLTDSAELTVNVVLGLPALGAVDSDGDAYTFLPITDGYDDVEGTKDSDGDGIPDYLDHDVLPSNSLQTLEANSDRFLLETEPGLSLQLGEVAFRAGGSQSSVSATEISTHANGGAGAVTDDEYDYIGGLFDFTVSGLPQAGDSVRVVIPQQFAIPEDAVYRKLQAIGWTDFVEDANNSVASTAGAEGYCPPPGDSAYGNGLTAGHWCVQLTIEDGGPNDGDAVANRKVDDPGGVAAVKTPTPFTPAPSTTSYTVTSSGGGGGLGALAVALLGVILAWRKRFSLQALLLALGLITAPASQADSWYVGGALGQMQGEEELSSLNAQLSAAGANATAQGLEQSRDGYSLFFGVPFLDRFAVEVAYVDLGDVQVQFQGSATDINTFLNSVQSVQPLTANGLSLRINGSWPVMEKLDVFAHAGMFYWEAEYNLSGGGTTLAVSEDGTDLEWAVGAEYRLRDRWAGRFEWGQFELPEPVGAISLGLIYYAE